MDRVNHEDDEEEQKIDLYGLFKRQWRNELFSPTLLPYAEDLIQEIQFNIDAQVGTFLALLHCHMSDKCICVPSR